MKMASSEYLDVESWRTATKAELLQFVKDRRPRAEVEPNRQRPSTLAVRQHLSPVDVYCYLKARFGEPNGFQNFLRTDSSDNWIHWDFQLKAGDHDVWVCGMSREVHFTLWTKMTDENWRDLIRGIKADFKRVGKEKSKILKTLERWVIFPNRFVEIANNCADLHADIVDNIGSYRSFKTPSFKSSNFKSKKARKEAEAVNGQIFERSTKVHSSSLKLSLLTPVMAEAFINMVILILCKKDIRNNNRQFDAFIRSQIDTKLYDLAYKCEGFVRPIDQNSETFKNFKRVMDKRNHAAYSGRSGPPIPPRSGPLIPVTSGPLIPPASGPPIPV
jgi:hypothetical protein